MNKRVLYFLLQPIHSRPPCLAEVCTLRDMGIEVAVLTTGCDALTKQLLDYKGVPCQIFEPKEFPIMPIQRGINMVNYYFAFRAFWKKYWTDNSVLWIGSEQSAIKLWRYLKNHRPIILNALEFYEHEWYQTGMKKVIPGVDILTACEPTRAQYMVDWWKLDRMPYILRNKPYGAIAPKGSGSTPELQLAISELKGKKVLLYQGAIVGDRDLSVLAKSLREAGNDFYLVLSGPDKDGGVAKLKAIYDKVLYLGNFPAPSHLEITHYATACVAFYKDNCINNRYCAPNKIYEYAGCGAPMLCNPIPGLTETVGKAGAGECVDFSDPQAVMAALERISSNYERYHLAALEFYNTTDNTETMKAIATDAFSRTKAARA